MGAPFIMAVVDEFWWNVWRVTLVWL